MRAVAAVGNLHGAAADGQITGSGVVKAVGIAGVRALVHQNLRIVSGDGHVARELHRVAHIGGGARRVGGETAILYGDAAARVDSGDGFGRQAATSGDVHITGGLHGLVLTGGRQGSIIADRQVS